MRATVAIRAAAAPEGAWRLDDDKILMLCINLFVVRTASKSAGDRDRRTMGGMDGFPGCAATGRKGLMLRGGRTFQSVVGGK